MMPIRFPRVLTLSLFVMSLGCETPRWSQFHGDTQSQGNLATNTSPTFIAKWPAPVNVRPDQLRISGRRSGRYSS